ncbi:6-phosphogluconate dehydrogenase [Halteromyces radiatus]|uniref:6-phosphogluconate dehydrogenase n=1 Tax=Halteromyces radiatus TaxID=101107 RepID=UPI0022211B23|nr:6-phosphogluconate dehydrogenase [Halteromyces radiatus]KAI8093173.1 6-phosphogluconate dehydrogenase [Halteromyces radiatus]
MVSRNFTTTLRTITRTSRPLMARPMMFTVLKQFAVKATIGTEEVVYERSDVSKEKLLETFKDDTIAVLGYALNSRNNGVKQAIEEDWIPGKNLFPLLEAVDRGTIDQTNISSLPKISMLCLLLSRDLDSTVSRLFQEGHCINRSFTVYQDASGKAKERYLYEATFEKEIYPDLFGERSILTGAIQGLFQAQYEVFRANGYSPSEAFNETVEEDKSIYPLIGERGMGWIYSNCSTIAQRDALDWWRPFHNASKPVFEQLHRSVRDGSETARSLDRNCRPDYREKLEEELREIPDQTLRQLRPENADKN